MKISLLVAMSDDRVIGHNGRLPWHLSADLRRFKRLTMGHHLIMGRRTFNSIGKPLAGRTSVVLSRQPDFCREGIIVAHSWEDALRHCHGDDEPFVIGGGDLYRQVLPLVDRLYVTRVHAKLAGDTFFPIVTDVWKLTNSESLPADDQNEFGMTFETFEHERNGTLNTEH